MTKIGIEVKATGACAAGCNKGKDHEFTLMKDEYPGYTGEKMWILYSALPQERLQELYPEEFAEHMPYIYMNPEQSEVVKDYHRNEHKHEMRSIRRGDAYGYEDGVTEIFHNEIGSTDVLDDLIAVRDAIMTRQSIQQAIGEMTEVQKRRFIRHFFDGMTMRQIAEEEGSHFTTVQESLDGAMKKIRKYF